jgi:hypothetical protein
MGLIIDTRRPIILIDGQLIRPSAFGLNQRYDADDGADLIPTLAVNNRPLVTMECEYRVGDIVRYQTIEARSVTLSKRRSGRRLIEVMNIVSAVEWIGMGTRWDL